MPNRASLGGLQLAEGRWELVFTRELRHAPEKVWRALTEPEHLREWFPSDIEGERVVGAVLQFVFRENEGPTIAGEMLVYDPPRLLEFRWGDELLRFELAASAHGTTLRFVNTFDELGKAARDAAGWHTCLGLLEYDLAGEPAPQAAKDLWREIHETYVEHLGAEAATIGPPDM